MALNNVTDLEKAFPNNQAEAEKQSKGSISFLQCAFHQNNIQFLHVSQTAHNMNSSSSAYVVIGS